MLSRLLGETIEIAMLAGDELPPVLADRVQLEQVVINLAINARDAMPGGGTLAIETSFSDGHVRLAVSDTAAGSSRNCSSASSSPSTRPRRSGWEPASGSRPSTAS